MDPGVGKSLKSLNFFSKKRDLEKMIQDNLLMMNKINLAVPSVQHSEHKEHARNTQKLKRLVSFKSQRQSMVATVRNYFVSKFQ